ncbi:MAG TPA: DUF6132 family protein [Draconibacterium sp.]|nr:DUF6132 family protein [Draconibacterium sp.]
MRFFKQKQLAIILLVTGALGGFLYWKFVGCVSGTCPIKSVWYWSTLWGAAIGYLIGDGINDFMNKRKRKTEEYDREV